jgi:WD40 repeat protein
VSEGAHEAGRLAVFLSYSRDDLNFADQLEAALRSYTYDVAIDRHGISGGEDWKIRLGGLIRDADTVIFVLSPSSATSELCKWEVEQALGLSKRVIPVLCRALGDTSVPLQLSALNYIFFYDEPRSPGSGFGTGLARLVSALNTDLDWLREHTRLLQRASEWDSTGRTESRLLFGDSIAEAKAWAARRPKNAPEPTALHYEYIRASEEAEARRQHAERQQLEQIAAAQADRARALAEREEAQEGEAEQARRVVRRTLTGLAVAIVLGLLASAAGWEAATERDHAKNALAQVFAERSWSALSSGNRDLAIRYAIAGWRVAPLNAVHYRAPLAHALASTVVPVVRKLLERRITTLTASPDGKYVISGGDDGLAVLLDTESLNPLRKFQHQGPLTAAMPDPTGKKVLTISDDAVIHIWDAATGKEETRLLAHTNRVIAASFSPDAERLLSASLDKTAKLWDLSTGRLLSNLVGHTDAVSAATFSPDGRLLVTGSWDGTAKIWDGATGNELRILAGHSGAVTSIAFSPDGRFLLTGSADKAVLAWDVLKYQSNPKKLTGHESGIRAASVSLDGSKAYVIDFNGNAYIWDILTSSIVVASPSTANGQGLASFTVDGRYAAISDQAGALRVWDADAARTLVDLRGRNSATVSALMWSKTRLFVGDTSGALSVYDLTEWTKSIDELVASACEKEKALSPRFTWMESAADPLIREVWDPEGVMRPVCQ